MTSDTAPIRQRRADLLSPDLSPACPRCGDLCGEGARYCPECGVRLLPADAYLGADGGTADGG